MSFEATEMSEGAAAGENPLLGPRVPSDVTLDDAATRLRRRLERLLEHVVPEDDVSYMRVSEYR